ncbi:2-succinyl-6-hydroxy-2,4-cyclohexadiene-1-carboxylate synthase [Kosakonia radicincitans]|uniref:2-succinyl-6-hydroxy-2, 4-cyclohexadiene-1-carboxylate synthase n=1 Tax=Kosakonia radicincitans TaxID=283686 RepID=UPI0008CA2441|nr:2-succinyl-6-hydroxy-2,4-cyclohexadiene-1-carboxylate synthase [Kosakonia radicincitans]SES75350.1 2-succinyl-6-hydroxy-2,4-cyclohexadiene-1-carboxylate synthase [Kosakonia radicincitans]
MTLHGRAISADRPQLWLVFLHGFSGDNREWQAVSETLTAFPRLLLDLPGHGGSADLSVASFDEMDALLRATLIRYNIQNYWLIGYSLGGRISMYHACQRPAGLCGVVIEGGHPGLTDATSRRERLASDRQWAARFRQQPLEAVFDAWYRQPVFASLSEPQRAALVALRSQNNGAMLADMLEATSLAQQPDLRSTLRALSIPVHYLYGEYDSKFQALATQVTGYCHAIPAAGHNAHRENPAAVADTLARILRLEIKDTL